MRKRPRATTVFNPFNPSRSDQMAGHSHVQQAGDHHGDPEHPPGGQEQEGEKVSHHLRGHEARRDPETGDHAETPECR